jgi:hypothetical protein
MTVAKDNMSKTPHLFRSPAALIVRGERSCATALGLKERWIDRDRILIRKSCLENIEIFGVSRGQVGGLIQSAHALWFTRFIM